MSVNKLKQQRRDQIKNQKQTQKNKIISKLKQVKLVKIK